MAEPLVVTLDGPAGVGKTTLAKRVAGALGIPYLDTGAMFRASALALGREGASLPPDEIRAQLAALSFSLSGTGADSILSVNGKALGDEIRSESVAMLASNAATLPVVREVLKSVQQALGREGSLVAEGRDMGSVVFPMAAYKFFLDAAPGIRAGRRVKQLTDMGREADYQAVLKAVIARDAQDRGRAVAPLKAADDAYIIDTGPLDVDGVFEAIMSKIKDEPA